MALREILADIEKNREERLAYIRSQCAGELDNISKLSIEELKDLQEDFNARLTSDIDVTRRREHDSINMEKNSIILNRKTEIVNILMEHLVSKLEELKKGKEYEDILSDSLIIAEKELGRDFIVNCSPEDFEFLKGKKKEINMKKDPSIKMGIICYSANAEKIIDFRIDRLFKEIKPELEARILENIGAN